MAVFLFQEDLGFFGALRWIQVEREGEVPTSEMVPPLRRLLTLRHGKLPGHIPYPFSTDHLLSEISPMHTPPSPIHTPTSWPLPYASLPLGCIAFEFSQ